MNCALHIADSIHDYCCLPPPSRSLGPCQDGEPAGMRSTVGLGKRMTQSARTVVGSQPSPAQGLGLGQQQKNNTLLKQPGPQCKPFPQLPPLCSPRALVNKPFHPHTPAQGLLGAPGPAAPSAWVGSKVPPSGTETLPLFLPDDAFLPFCLSLPINSLLLHCCFWKIVLKTGKDPKETSKAFISLTTCTGCAASL